MNKAEQLLHEILEKEYGNTLEDCIEWAIIKYFDEIPDNSELMINDPDDGSWVGR